MIQLNYICFFNGSGYSQAAQDLIFALERSGNYDIRAQQVMENARDAKAEATMTPERRQHFDSLLAKPPDKERVNIYHCVPTIQQRVKYAKHNVGFATFETYDPPKEWLTILNHRNDASIVPSQFNLNIFAHAGVKKPLVYVPHCIDFDTYGDDVERVKRSKFTFLFLGTWRKRKGYEELLEAWFLEFSGKDNVQLLIKTDYTHKAQAYMNKVKRSMGLDKKDTAPILFENKVFDELNLPKFMKSVDCLISPHKGEGFGLPGLQCMALGVPVVITNFAGCQDYANEETATLLEPTGFKLLNGLDEYPQFRKKKWAFVSVQDIRSTMRNVLENYDDAKHKAEYGKKFVRERFTYDHARNAFDELMGIVLNA